MFPPCNFQLGIQEIEKNVVIDYNKTPSLSKYAWMWMQCGMVCDTSYYGQA